MNVSPGQELSARKAYGRLWRDWLSPHWPRLLLAAVLITLIAGAAAGYAKFMQYVISAFEKSDASVIWWGPLGIILLTSTKGISQYFREITLNKVLSTIQVNMQSLMFDRLVYMDLDTLLAESPAALAARFSADIEIVRLATHQLFSAATALLTVVAAVWVMVSIDWAMTVGLIMIFFLAFGPVGVAGARVRKISSKTQAEIAHMTEAVNEGLSGIRMVRTYQLEERLKSSADLIFKKLFSLRISFMKWQASVSPLMEILGGFAVGALLFLVALRLQSGAIDLAGFIGLLTALGVATSPAQRLGGAYTLALQGMGALERVFGLFDSENTIEDGSYDGTGKKNLGQIEFEGVGFTYPDGYKALSDISLQISSGQTFAFVGRSGAGKSTVFNLLPRLFEVTTGCIKLDGRDIKDFTLNSLRDQISVVSQDSVLLSGTVLDNISFGRKDASKSDCIQAAKSAAAHAFISKLPQGYDTRIDPSNSGFSGGEKQRLSIARAILRDAPILLLDEPTSALDAESEAVIRQALDDLSKERTTLVIAHRLATILHADQIVVMDHGEVVDQGTHDQLLEREGIYADLFSLQFDGSGRTGKKSKPRSLKNKDIWRSPFEKLTRFLGG